MRECRIDRIRLCKTGSDERNASALRKTNPGSSLNSTLCSTPEILLGLEQRCESLNRNATQLRADDGQFRSNPHRRKKADLIPGIRALVQSVCWVWGQAEIRARC